MFKCLLGCGNVVHNIDQHVDGSHPEVRNNKPGHPGGWFPYVPDLREVSREEMLVMDARVLFLMEYFPRVTL